MWTLAATSRHRKPRDAREARIAIDDLASEANLLNVALFGQTARQWRDANPKLDGNMRDHATTEQLLVLANLESRNAKLIHMALPSAERLTKLNAIVIRQMQTLTGSAARLLERQEAS